MEAGARRRTGGAGDRADEVEGTYVDSNGEGHHGRGKVKNHRSQSGVQGEEGEETESPKRKVIRVEFEETQDYVREAKSTDHEDVEELSFVPSAISVPQKMIYRCDDQCSEKTLSFWQLAPVVIREGEESYTTNTVPDKLVTLHDIFSELITVNYIT